MNHIYVLMRLMYLLMQRLTFEKVYTQVNALIYTPADEMVRCFYLSFPHTTIMMIIPYYLHCPSST